MKKFSTIISFCFIFLLFSCTTDELDENVVKQNIETVDLSPELKYISLQELKNDNSSFSKFQQLQQDLNNLRKANNTDQFDFLIGEEKILFVEDTQFKIFTFPLHKVGNNKILENLVLKIDKKGKSQSYIVKYNLIDSDKTKIKNGEFFDLKNKIEVYPLTDLISSLNIKKNGSTNKDIIQFLSRCYELQAYKHKDVETGDTLILYQYVEVDCIDYFEMPWDPSYTLINPSNITSINSNISTYIQYGAPFALSEYTYLLGNDFSSYPVLDDPIEDNNINARYFFDSLTINERKWILLNLSTYNYLLQKLNEKYWSQPYVQFAQDVVWQVTRYRICHWKTLTPEIETELFYQAMAGAKIISVGELCPDEYSIH